VVGVGNEELMMELVASESENVRTATARLASSFTRSGKYFGSQRSQWPAYLPWRVVLLASRVMTGLVFAFLLTSVLDDLGMHHDS